MIVKFIDKEGSLCVVTVKDASDFRVSSNDSGTYDIYMQEYQGS